MVYLYLDSYVDEQSRGADVSEAVLAEISVNGRLCKKSRPVFKQRPSSSSDSEAGSLDIPSLEDIPMMFSGNNVNSY